MTSKGRKPITEAGVLGRLHPRVADQGRANMARGRETQAADHAARKKYPTEVRERLQKKIEREHAGAVLEYHRFLASVVRDETAAPEARMAAGDRLERRILGAIPDGSKREQGARSPVLGIIDQLVVNVINDLSNSASEQSSRLPAGARTLLDVPQDGDPGPQGD